MNSVSIYLFVAGQDLIRKAGPRGRPRVLDFLLFGDLIVRASHCV